MKALARTTILVVAAALMGAVLATSVLSGRPQIGPPPGATPQATPLPRATPRPTPSPTPAPSPTPSPSPSTPVTPAPPEPTTAPASEDTVPPAPAPLPVTDRPELVNRLDRILDRRAPRRGTLGVTVLDEQGRLVLSRGGSRALVPASTQKLVTAAAALAALGPDFRYVTRVRAAGAVGDDGTMRGDLVLVGSGDPGLVSPTYRAKVAAERPHTSLRALADRVEAAGIRRVTGRLTWDDGVFADQPKARGWLDRYFDSFDARRVSGLTVDAGLSLYRRRGELRAKVADNPARRAAQVLAGLLRERGVRVRASGVSSEQGGPQVAEVTSPPLRALLTHTVQTSDNHMADAIFRTLDAVSGSASTWEGSARAARTVLAPLRLDWRGVVVADGSGLSRANRVTATFLASLHARMMRTAAAPLWQRSLAVAGRSGTLRGRLLGTVAEGRLYAKTGTLIDVGALAGIVRGPPGQRYTFAVLGNRLSGASKSRLNGVQDAVAVALAKDLIGCDLRESRRRPTLTPCAA